MRKFKDLTAADFPGIDAQKFDEWKQATQNAELYQGILLLAVILFEITLYLTTSYILVGLLPLAIFFFIWRGVIGKPARMGKEVGITPQRIKEARMRA